MQFTYYIVLWWTLTSFHGHKLKWVNMCKVFRQGLGTEYVLYKERVYRGSFQRPEYDFTRSSTLIYLSLWGCFCPQILLGQIETMCHSCLLCCQLPVQELLEDGDLAGFTPHGQGPPHGLVHKTNMSLARNISLYWTPIRNKAKRNKRNTSSFPKLAILPFRV